MGAIYLVRHGQASFGKANYDELSDVGVQQSEILGKYLANAISPDLSIAGSMVRHNQTAEGFSSGHGNTPTASVVEDFNEFDHRDVLHKYKPEWKETGAMTAEIGAEADPKKAFQHHFTAAVNRWSCGDFDDDYAETWAQFQDRCVGALQQVVKDANGAKSIVVFTSGGPIAVICQYLLGCDTKAAFEMNAAIANTSVTKLLFSKGRIGLSYLNNYSHLDVHHPELVTFR